MLLRVEHLVVEFGSGHHRVRAVSDVSFDVAAGETLGLVGRVRLRQVDHRARRGPRAQPRLGLGASSTGPSSPTLSRADLRQARTKIQMVFQDPISSLNPRRRVLDAVVEPLSVWGIGTKDERKRQGPRHPGIGGDRPRRRRRPPARSRCRAASASG